MRSRAAVAWIVTMGAAHGLGCGSSSHTGESSGGLDGGQATPEGGGDAGQPSTEGDGEAGLLASATTYFLTGVDLQLSCTASSCLCLPEVLPTDSAGQALCGIFFALAPGDTCAAHGLSAAAADVSASVQDLDDDPTYQTVCVLPQLPMSEWVNGSCSGSSQAGWCYVTGAAARTCQQVIMTSTTGMPPSTAVALLACGETPPSAAPQGTSSASIGIACTPSQESSASFAGFEYPEVTLDEDNPACGGDVCLVNHFRGLTSCPYGQGQDGGPTPGASAACTVPGTSLPVTADAPADEEVEPQCASRRASAAVYCSCRCANTAGKTDDGAAYCACPSDYSCTQVVPASQSGDPRAGAYCIKSGTAYTTSACTAPCDATQNNCP